MKKRGKVICRPQEQIISRHEGEKLNVENIVRLLVLEINKILNLIIYTIESESVGAWGLIRRTKSCQNVKIK
jgi:hypothetical protein